MDIMRRMLRGSSVLFLLSIICIGNVFAEGDARFERQPQQTIPVSGSTLQPVSTSKPGIDATTEVESILQSYTSSTSFPNLKVTSESFSSSLVTRAYRATVGSDTEKITYVIYIYQSGTYAITKYNAQGVWVASGLYGRRNPQVLTPQPVVATSKPKVVTPQQVSGPVVVPPPPAKKAQPLVSTMTVPQQHAQLKTAAYEANIQYLNALRALEQLYRSFEQPTEKFAITVAGQKVTLTASQMVAYFALYPQLQTQSNLRDMYQKVQHTVKDQQAQICRAEDTVSKAFSYYESKMKDFGLQEARADFETAKVLANQKLIKYNQDVRLCNQAWINYHQDVLYKRTLADGRQVRFTAENIIAFCTRQPFLEQQYKSEYQEALRRLQDYQNKQNVVESSYEQYNAAVKQMTQTQQRIVQRHQGAQNLAGAFTEKQRAWTAYQSSEIILQQAQKAYQTEILYHSQQTGTRYTAADIISIFSKSPQYQRQAPGLYAAALAKKQSYETAARLTVQTKAKYDQCLAAYDNMSLQYQAARPVNLLTQRS